MQTSPTEPGDVALDLRAQIAELQLQLQQQKEAAAGDADGSSDTPASSRRKPAGQKTRASKELFTVISGVEETGVRGSFSLRAADDVLPLSLPPPAAGCCCCCCYCR